MQQTYCYPIGGDDNPRFVPLQSAVYEPLQHVLEFFYGEAGWEPPPKEALTSNTHRPTAGRHTDDEQDDNSGSDSENNDGDDNNEPSDDERMHEERNLQHEVHDNAGLGNHGCNDDDDDDDPRPPGAAPNVSATFMDDPMDTMSSTPPSSPHHCGQNSSTSTSPYHTVTRTTLSFPRTS